MVTVPVSRDKMACVIRSRYADVPIPEDISWPQYIYEDFDKFGDKIAIVRTDCMRVVACPSSS